MHLEILSKEWRATTESVLRATDQLLRQKRQRPAWVLSICLSASVIVSVTKWCSYWASSWSARCLEQMPRLGKAGKGPSVDAGGRCR